VKDRSGEGAKQDHIEEGKNDGKPRSDE
jgi:hypothetical protein